MSARNLRDPAGNGGVAPQQAASSLKRLSAFSALITALVLAVAPASSALVFPSRGAESTGTTSTAAWDLAGDFAVAPDQANPNPDGLGNAGVWHFLQSATLAHDPGSYSLLASFVTDRGGVEGLEAWQAGGDPNDGLPIVGFNARTDNPFPLGVDWPSGTVLVHPLPDRLVVVGWRSPFTGKVQVSGGVTDRHAACGDGIVWSVDRGATTLASGAIFNGGAQLFASGAGGAGLASVQVATGDFLYFVVDPGPNADHTCDSTGLEVQIAAKRHL